MVYLSSQNNQTGQKNIYANTLLADNNKIYFMLRI